MNHILRTPMALLTRAVPWTLLALSLCHGAVVAPVHAQGTPSTIYLPLLSTGHVAPDLLFTPNTVSLAPGTTTTVQVRVDPAADLRGATFDFPDAQDGVTNRFEAAADGATGTLTIEASAASAADEKAIDVHGTSGVDSSKTWTGALTVKTTASLTAKTYFVDAAKGSDSNDGSQTKPFKTIKKALSKTVTGDTVKLSAGIYGVIPAPGGSGDTYPLTVPNGVKLEGAVSNGEPASELFGGVSTSDIGLALAGDSTIKNLDLRNFGAAVFATKGTLSLTTIRTSNNRVGAILRGTAKATVRSVTMLVGTDQTAMVVEEQARLFITSGTIVPKETTTSCGGMRAFAVANAARATIQNMLITLGAGRLLDLTGTANVHFASNAEQVVPNGCRTAALVTARDSASFTMSTGLYTTNGESGISWSSTGALTIERATLAGFTRSAVELLAATKLTVNTSNFDGNPGIAIDALRQSGATITIASSNFFGNGTSIRAQAFKLRNSTLMDFNGLVLLGNGADLGTAADPGGNTLVGNSNTALVFLSSTVSGVTVQAAGNTWNANVQGADAQGHYPHTLVSGPTSGKNFNLSTGQSIQF